MKSVVCISCWFFFVSVVFGQSKEIKWWGETSLKLVPLEISEVLDDGENLYFATGFSRVQGQHFPDLVKLDGSGAVTKVETLKEDADGKEIGILLGAKPYERDLYAYYVNQSEPGVVYRDRIDKTSLALSGEPAKVMEGNPIPINLLDPIWEKKEQMNVFFANYTEARLITGDHGNHIIVKKDTPGRKDLAEIRITVIGDDLVVLNTLDIKLKTTNTDTRLYDVVSDSIGGVYLILGDFTEKIPVVSLHYYPPGNDKGYQAIINRTHYFHAMQGAAYRGGLVISGLRSEKPKQYDCEHVALHVDPGSLTVRSEHILGEAKRYDLLYLLTNNRSCVAFVEHHNPSSLTTTSSGNTRHTSRISYGLDASLIDSDGTVRWTENIKNEIAAPGPIIWYDSVLPFVHRGRYYLIQNTHPETHTILRKDGKLKTATYGKDRFATEFITLNTEGTIDREYIYHLEHKMVTVPMHTRLLKDGRLLFYGDGMGMNSLVRFGVMEVE